MKRLISIALCIFLSQISHGQVMMMFSSDSLVNITSPLDLDSLFYWFAADQGVTDSLGGAIATNEGVGTWADLSGNGYNVTQTTDGARPVWKATGGPGSKPTIQFDGSNDFLASATHWWGSDDLTVFVVMKFANATRNAVEAVIARTQGGTTQRQWNLAGRNTADSYKIQSDAYKDGGTTNIVEWDGDAKSVSYRLIVHTSDGAGSATLHINGSSKTWTKTILGTGDGTILNTSTNVTIGIANAAAPNSQLQGSISEIIVYSRALSATERTAIETYLNRKYDLY